MTGARALDELRCSEGHQLLPLDMREGIEQMLTCEACGVCRVADKNWHECVIQSVYDICLVA